MADNIVVKITADATELKETNKVLAESGKISKETEQRFSDLQKATTKADASFKSLRQQIKEAKDEATRLSQQFGENSVQANKAAQRVANLTEELSDFNQRVGALNPEAKFNALNQVIGGSIGAFQGLTGALQLFGGESEEVQKIAQRLQGFLNLTQGLNSVLGLKDAFANLRVVLTAATASTTALSTATTGVAVAEGAATAGATAFGVAFTAATGGIILLIAGLVTAIYAVEKALDDSAESTERLKKKWDDLDAARTTYDKTFIAKRDEILDTYDFEIKKLEAVGASEEKIIQAKIKRINAELAANRAAIASGKGSLEINDQLVKSNKALSQELELLKLKLDNIKPIKSVVDKKSVEKDIDYIKGLPADIEDGLEPIKVKVEIPKVEETFSDIFNKELFEKLDKEQEERLQNSIQLAQTSFDFILGLSKNSTQARINDLQEQKNAGILSEQQYQKKLKEIRIQQAKEEKQAAIFQIIVDTAVAIIKALSKSGNPATIPLIGFIGATQLALVASQPIPKFKKGSKFITGGNGGEDDILAYLNRGEAVIPTDINKDYHKTISAIFHKSVSAKDLNNFVVNKTSGNSNVTASINPYDLARGLKRSNREVRKQAEITGEVIARKLASTYNPRHVI